MALRQFKSMAYDDDDLLDMGEQGEGATYPPTLCFCISEEDLEQAAGSDRDIGATMRFSAMGTVKSVNIRADWTRIELELTMFAGDDGKFFDLSQHAHICLCDQELRKLDLDPDCELGDMIHLIGTVRLDGISRTEFGEMATLQITDLDFEDESTESREE